jgi:hypothetical protein
MVETGATLSSQECLSTVASGEAVGSKMSLSSWRNMPTEIEDASEIIFSAVLDYYLQSKGLEQRQRRQDLVRRLANSRYSEKRVNQVLAKLSEFASEDRLTAAIDLLAEADLPARSRAIDLAVPRKEAREPSDDELYVIGMAAAKADSKMIHRVLLRSPRQAVREAGVDALADQSTIEAKPLLKKVAENDGSPYLRKRAMSLLEELD